MAANPFEESPDYVQSLARSLQVLRAFGHDLPSPSLSEIAVKTGLSRAVVRRILLTLQHLGYVGARGRSFFLTPRVLELGYSYLSSLDLNELAQQTMEQLAQKVGESCSLAVLDGNDIVYVLRVAVRRVMSIGLGVGARLPAFAASMGRVMLADLPDAELDAWMQGNKFQAYTPKTLRNARALKGGTAGGAQARLCAGVAGTGTRSVFHRRADPRGQRLRGRRPQREHAVQRQGAGPGGEGNPACLARRAT